MSFLEGLNPQQRAAVEHVEGPLLLLAGAGSGKTRVITHRIAHMVSEYHVPGPAILAVTFTNKAASEMRERVQNLLGETSTSMTPMLSTFHSFCVRMLRRDGAPLADFRPGFTTRFTIYDDDDQLMIIKAIYRQLGLDEKWVQYRGALSRISNAKSHRVSPSEFAAKAQDPVSERLAVVYQKYEDALVQANALDFDDLLLESVRLLAKVDHVRELYNRRYEFVMIDEYQDTNRTQYDLMRLLTEVRHNVCVVGDEDQSIYGWRGADIRNILDFERDYPDAKVIRLEQNYRSTKTILEAASAVVAHNTERKGKNLWTSGDQGDQIVLYEALDGENEALWIADQIENVLTREPQLRVAILYRTNFQSRQIEEALRRYRRKYAVVGGLSFYQRAEIKDMMAYLKVLQSPQDSLALLRVINVPARGIGKTTTDQMEQFALQHDLTLWSALERMIEQRAFGARAESALKSFRDLIVELRGMLESKPLNELIEAVLDLTGYGRMLTADPTPESESRLQNLQELVNAAAEAVERGESLADFLDHAALVADADQVDERAQVSLLTMHNAKGLEFPVVFLAGLEEGLFPHMRSLDSPGMLEEERRLCYVGMTRAERKLFLSWARYRRRFGGGPPEASIPSRFLREVPRGLIKAARAGSGMDTMQVNLLAEQHLVRESVKKNLYTGKTYNSVDHIRQFFSEKGMPAPRGLTEQAPKGPPAAPPQYPPAQPKVAPVVRPAAPKKKFGAGSVVQHPKYGRGTVLRREGEGDDAKLTISFPGYGLKKIVEKFAGIRVEE